MTQSARLGDGRLGSRRSHDHPLSAYSLVDERKAFMSSCLKGNGEAMPMTQQETMKKCNTDASAKALKGDDRKAFMSECLKADHKM
jgi:hypothetical protein